MTKKLSSSINLRPEDCPEYDHSKLEEFLEQYDDVEKYSRDGMSHYSLIMRNNFSMGTSGLANIGRYIVENFPNYNVHWYPQDGHSGFIWRDIFRITGGLKNYDVYKKHLGKLYAYTDRKDVTAPEVRPYGDDIMLCQYCKRIQQCYDQKDKGGHMCGKCFSEKNKL
jgi:hypothetical protein